MSNNEQTEVPEEQAEVEPVNVLEENRGHHKPKDPLRTSRTSSAWIGAVGFGVVLVLLVVFIVQNTRKVRITFLGWNWTASLAVALLLAVAGGILITAIAGSLRILQLRRRVRHARRQNRKDAKSAK
jgi:putative membrane protein